jgi:hypothetical protein
MWAIAGIITDLAENNPDYALFHTEWVPFYGAMASTSFGRLKSVDPDDVAPYVNAWVAWAVENRASFTATKAKTAMVLAGFDNTLSTVVANAMWRLSNTGELPLIIASPAGWAADAGVDTTDVGVVLNSIGNAAKTGVTATYDIIRYLPYIGLAVAAFVAWPYIAAARKPGSAANRVAGGL